MLEVLLIADEHVTALVAFLSYVLRVAPPSSPIVVLRRFKIANTLVVDDTYATHTPRGRALKEGGPISHLT